MAAPFSILSCDAGADNDQAGILIKGVQEGSYFYRLKASYELKPTGEPLEFDIVVACNVKVTNWRSGGQSIDTAREPRVMIKATPDGGAVMIRTLAICKNKTLALAPEKIFPMTIVFDDVNDLSLGWGYSTEDAYESPLSKLTFIGASVSRSNADEWMAWREKAKAEYKHKGMLPGPWGYSYSGSSDELQDAVRDAGGGRDIANTCLGYKRLKLPESIHQKILEHWPDEADRYWVYGEGARKGLAPKGEVPKLWLWNLLFDESVRFEGGFSYAEYRAIRDRSAGLVLRDGEGFVADSKNRDVKRPTAQYPLLSRSQTIGRPVSEPLNEYPRKILISEDRKGFLRCGGAEPVDGLAVSYYGKTRGNSWTGEGLETIDGEALTPGYVPKIKGLSLDLDYRSKEHPLFVNDDLADSDINPFVPPSFILDKEGFVLDLMAWGVGGV